MGRWESRDRLSHSPESCRLRRVLLAEQPATSYARDAEQASAEKREAAGFRCSSNDEAIEVLCLTVLQAENTRCNSRHVCVDDKDPAGLPRRQAIGRSKTEPNRVFIGGP